MWQGGCVAWRIAVATILHLFVEKKPLAYFLTTCICRSLSSDSQLKVFSLESYGGRWRHVCSWRGDIFRRLKTIKHGWALHQMFGERCWLYPALLLYLIFLQIWLINLIIYLCDMNLVPCCALIRQWLIILSNIGISISVGVTVRLTGTHVSLAALITAVSRSAIHRGTFTLASQHRNLAYVSACVSERVCGCMRSGVRWRRNDRTAAWRAADRPPASECSNVGNYQSSCSQRTRRPLCAVNRQHRRSISSSPVTTFASESELLASQMLSEIWLQGQGLFSSARCSWIWRLLWIARGLVSSGLLASLYS